VVNSRSPVIVRTATTADLDAIVAAMTTAFFVDPLWGPTFPDVDLRATQAAALWRLLVSSSMRHGWTLVTANAESAAVWITPGESELTVTEQHGLEGFLTEVAGPQVTAVVLEISEQFEAARPDEPHYYLSLLATHDDHRGAGLGMGLLRESLNRIDALGLPAYLESSNPANDRRYEAVGFTRLTRLTMPGGQQVSTMWRPAQDR
jgi:GNAT superfamily N-acetyltransferase